MDIGVAYAALTMDTITEYAMGKSLGCLDMDDFNKNLVKSSPNLELSMPRASMFPYYLSCSGNSPAGSSRNWIRSWRLTRFSQNNALPPYAGSTIGGDQQKTMFHTLLTKEGTDLAAEGEAVLSGGAALTPRP